MQGLTLLVYIFAIAISSMDLALAIVWRSRADRSWKWSPFLIVFASTLLGVVFSYALVNFSFLVGKGLAGGIAGLIWQIIFQLDVAFLLFFIPLFLNWVIARPFPLWEKMLFAVLDAAFVAVSITGYFMDAELTVRISYLIFTSVILYAVIIEIPMLRQTDDRNTRKVIITIVTVASCCLPLFVLCICFPAVQQLLMPCIALCFFIMLLVFLFIAIGNQNKKEAEQRTERTEVKTEKAREILEEYHITDRETDIIRLIKAGLTNKEIAGKLSISVNTVNNHIANIFSKTGVRCRIDLLNLIEEASW